MDIKRFLVSAGILIKSRLQYIFIWTWAIAVPCLIVGRGFPPLLPTFKAIFSMIFISISVYVYNDLIDYKLDQQNKVKNDRPLAAGKILTTDAMNLVYLSAFIGIAIGATLNLQAFIYILLFYVLFTIYSWPSIHLKKRFLMKETIIMLGNFINAVAASYAVAGEIVPSALFIGVLASIFCISSQPALWDTTDIEVDRLEGMKTLAMLLGWRAKIAFLFSGVIALMIITSLFYSNFGFNFLFPFSVVIGGFIFLGYTAPLYNGYNETKVLMSKKAVIGYWTICQIVSIFSIMNPNFIF